MGSRDVLIPSGSNPDWVAEHQKWMSIGTSAFLLSSIFWASVSIGALFALHGDDYRLALAGGGAVFMAFALLCLLLSWSTYGHPEVVGRIRRQGRAKIEAETASFKDALPWLLFLPAGAVKMFFTPSPSTL